MTTNTPNPPTTPGQFRRRLGYYLVGLAVGCVLLGLLQVARNRELARMRAQQDAQVQPAAGDQ